MHTTGLRSQDFAIAVDGEMATLDDVFLPLTGRSLRDDSPVPPGRAAAPEHESASAGRE